MTTSINWDYLDLPPTNGNPVLSWTAGILVTLPVGLTGSYCLASTVATEETILNIYIDDVLVGLITFAASSGVGSFTFTSQQSINPGAVMDVIPQSSDATLAGLTGVFLGM